MSSPIVPSEPLPIDRDAVEIGELYAKSNSSLIDAVIYRLECGQRLAAKKTTLSHGQWLPWLEVNANTLMFSSDRTAQRLMEVAAKNTTPASYLEAIQASRLMWGHRKQKPPPQEDEPAGEEEDEEQYEELTDEEARRMSFLIRAGEALRYAVYKGPPDAELAKAAHQTAEAWMNLATKLEG